MWQNVDYGPDHEAADATEVVPPLQSVKKRKVYNDSDTDFQAESEQESAGEADEEVNEDVDPSELQTVEQRAKEKEKEKAAKAGKTISIFKVNFHPPQGCVQGTIMAASASFMKKSAMVPQDNRPKSESSLDQPTSQKASLPKVKKSKGTFVVGMSKESEVRSKIKAAEEKRKALQAGIRTSAFTEVIDLTSDKE